ncbi:hypothetical protein GQ42DRAFT_160574 [Ramicandelaber brevisporus]|nr:hypothetical protein GQ42DRAFT_160574 [Ramicandelaber brevisporus]
MQSTVQLITHSAAVRRPQQLLAPLSVSSLSAPLSRVISSRVGVTARHLHSLQASLRFSSGSGSGSSASACSLNGGGAQANLAHLLPRRLSRSASSPASQALLNTTMNLKYRSFSSSTSGSGSGSGNAGRSQDQQQQSEAPHPEQKMTLKQLMQKYGKVALVVYLAISTVDLGLCITAVHFGGQDMVVGIESWIGENIGEWAVPKLATAKPHPSSQPGAADGSLPVADIAQMATSGQSAPSEQEDQVSASWATTIAIGYLFHKMLMPVRVPITAALTPSAAKYLARYRWFAIKKP